ncbi:SDR family oxidoreductase [Litoreibacter sp.]|nr:SDR family oxidoreductase [Litoreibacter sp.]
MTITVLVTGCASGFGKKIARTCWKNGWNVVATMRAPQKELDLHPGQKLLLERMDVTDPESISQAFARSRQRYGTIDAVVNSAGFGGVGVFEQFQPDEIVKMFETNVFGAMNVMREALPEMRAAGEGTIVNVTSLAGYMGLPGNSVYSASKYALVGLTEAMAMEYALLGVRIFSVAPGAYTQTGFARAANVRTDQGDDQISELARSLQARKQAAQSSSETVRTEFPDPQEVADHVYSCLVSNQPIHTPSGRDAVAMFNRMESQSRQSFLNKIEEMLVPNN